MAPHSIGSRGDRLLRNAENFMSLAEETLGITTQLPVAARRTAGWFLASEAGPCRQKALLYALVGSASLNGRDEKLTEPFDLHSYAHRLIRMRRYRLCVIGDLFQSERQKTLCST